MIIWMLVFGAPPNFFYDVTIFLDLSNYFGEYSDCNGGQNYKNQIKPKL